MQVTVPCFAKLNLDLRVLHRRADGYHELRTIFQTISLKDTLRIEFDRAQQTAVELNSSIDIPDNLVVRAAKLALAELGVDASVRFALNKQIPLGAGLGGGSSNAAAVLLALPALAGRTVPVPQLLRWAESLGSDVGFFLLGGTALGLGRGTEVYPLPDEPARTVVVVSSGVHVSTKEAYAALGRPVTDALTSSAESPMLGEFQTIAWNLGGLRLDQLPLKNDFEEPVFEHHRELAISARKLQETGGNPVLMTGSGSAIFGVFESPRTAKEAAAQFATGSAHVVHFVSRRQYRRAWRRALEPAGASAGISESSWLASE